MSENGWTKGWWPEQCTRMDGSTVAEWTVYADRPGAEPDDEPTVIAAVFVKSAVPLIAAAPALAEALEAMRTWLGVVADKIDLDPDETRVTINAVSPSGVREVAARSLRDIYEQADAALSLAEGKPS